MTAHAAVAQQSHWTPVPGVPGVYSYEKLLPEGWGLRTTAIQLTDGGVALVSPTRRLPADVLAELDAIGPTRVLLAPNHFHHLGLAEHLARTPGARAVASERARPRVAKKSGCAIEPLAALRELLPPHVTLLEPDGLRNGEVFLRATSPASPRDVAWIVTDAFFHWTRPLAGPVGLFLRASGTAPGLRIGSTFKWLALGHAETYRGWITRALRDAPPTVLVPAHGDVLGDPHLGERLTALVAARI